MKVIKSLIYYLETGSSDQVEYLVEIEGMISLPELRSLVTRILSWISRRRTFDNKKDLKLKREKDLSNLRVILDNYPDFAKLFKLEKDVMNFSNSISEEVVIEIEGYVEKNYRPRIRRKSC